MTAKPVSLGRHLYEESARHPAVQPGSFPPWGELTRKRKIFWTKEAARRRRDGEL